MEGKRASGGKKGTKQRRYYEVIKMVSLQITTLGGWHTMKRGVKEGGYLLALICRRSSFLCVCVCMCERVCSVSQHFLDFCRAFSKKKKKISTCRWTKALPNS